MMNDERIKCDFFCSRLRLARLQWLHTRAHGALRVVAVPIANTAAARRCDIAAHVLPVMEPAAVAVAVACSGAVDAVNAVNVVDAGFVLVAVHVVQHSADLDCNTVAQRPKDATEAARGNMGPEQEDPASAHGPVLSLQRTHAPIRATDPRCYGHHNQTGQRSDLERVLSAYASPVHCHIPHRVPARVPVRPSLPQPENS